MCHRVPGALPRQDPVVAPLTLPPPRGNGTLRGDGWGAWPCATPLCHGRVRKLHAAGLGTGTLHLRGVRVRQPARHRLSRILLEALLPWRGTDGRHRAGSGRDGGVGAVGPMLCPIRCPAGLVQGQGARGPCCRHCPWAVGPGLASSRPPQSRSAAPWGWGEATGVTQPLPRGLLRAEASVLSLHASRGRGVASGARREEAGGREPFLPDSLSRDHLGLPGAGEARDAVTWWLSLSRPAWPGALGWTGQPVAARWPREGGTFLSTSRSARALVISASPESQR